MRVDARVYIKAKRAGRATSVRVAPTGTAVEQYQVPLGNRHSLKEAGVIGLPSWSDRATQTETWVKVPRLSATCPRRVVAFDRGTNAAIDRVMEFGDEFAGSALDTAKWISSGGVTVSGGICNLTYSGDSGVIQTTGGYGQNTAMRVRLKTVDQYFMFGYDSRPVTQYAINYGYSSFGGRWRYYTKASTENEIVTTAPGTDWNTYDIIRNGATSVIYQRNGANRGTCTAQIPTGNINIMFSLVESNSNQIDWILIRKYTASEPLTGTAQPTATNRALSRPLNHAGLIRAVCT